MAPLRPFRSTLAHAVHACSLQPVRSEIAHTVSSWSLQRWAGGRASEQAGGRASEQAGRCRQQ